MNTKEIQCEWLSINSMLVLISLLGKVALKEGFFLLYSVLVSLM